MDKNNNTGINNSGHWNSGHWNSGDGNSGHRNSGDGNSGHRNSGDGNSGHRNSGHWNSGDGNSGHRNSGHWNSGDGNSGHGNSGDRNSGDGNSGDRNSGIFNTNEPKMRMFNKDSDFTYSEFRGKFGRGEINLPLSQWIELKDMTQEERKEYPLALQMDGYLKTLDYKEAWKIGWEKATQEQKDWYKNLPNFSKDIFQEITGIDIDVCEAVKEGDEIEVCTKGKKFKAKIIK